MLQAEGVVSYTWQGGEPSLRGLDFFQKAVWYQQKYNRSHVRIINAFQTQGHAATHAWCQYFRYTPFRVGL